MDGNEGVRVADTDVSRVFDSDDMTIKAARTRRYRIPVTLHSRRLSLCINKEHTMQYVVAGWPVVSYPSESLLERITRKLRGGWKRPINILNQLGVPKNGSNNYGYPD